MKDPYHYIEAYLKDRMTPDDRIAFEKAMLEDPALREAMENYPLIEPFLDLLLEEDARKKLDAIRSKSSKQITGMTKWWKIAAAILIICFAAAGTWQATMNSMPHLYSEFMNEPVKSATRNAATTPKIAEDRSREAYDLMEHNDLAGAEKILTEMALSENKNIRWSAQWYLIGLSLKSKNKNQAIKRLEEFLNNNPDDAYRQDALALQKRLTGFLGF